MITVIKMHQQANLKRKIGGDEKDLTKTNRSKISLKEKNQVFPILALSNEIIIRIASFLTLKDLVSKFLVNFNSKQDRLGSVVQSSIGSAHNLPTQFYLDTADHVCG